MAKRQKWLISLILLVGLFIRPVFAQIPGSDVPGFMKWFSDSVQNGINWLLKTTISPNNPTVNSTGLISATNSTFKAVNNLGNAGYNIAQAIASFVNSFYGIHISFWAILAISFIISLVFIVKNGEGMLKKTLILIIVIIAIVIIIPILGLQNTILSNLP